MLGRHNDGCMHVRVNDTVVAEGSCSGKGELEGVIRRKKAVVVEHSRVARDGMGRIADIFPDYGISRFDGQSRRLKKVSAMLFHHLDGVNDVTSLKPKSRCLG